MTMHYQKSDPIILGSGELFIGFANEIIDPEILTTEEEAKLINIGAIESGATIDIANEYKEIKSANRGTVAKFKIDSSCKFSTGICTWVLENISKFLTGSKFTEDKTEGKRKMVIGKDDTPPVVYLRFVHTKKDGSGELIVNMYKAQFDGDLNFVFENENPVTINYEFAGMTNNNNNYVEFVETFPAEEVLP